MKFRFVGDRAAIPSPFRRRFDETSAVSNLAEHPLLLPVSSTKPSCQLQLAQRALTGALLMAETTAALPIAISVSMMNARTRFFIGRRPATAVLGVHGSPVLPARTSGLPIRARA